MRRRSTPPANDAVARLHIVHDGFARFMLASLRLASGALVEREIEDHGEAVAVLPYDPDRRTATLVRQTRAPVLFLGLPERSLEAPAGLLERDANVCARREVLEETGLALDSLDPVGTVWTMPGLSTERVHLFLARYGAASRVASGGGLADEHEDITVEERALGELAAMADSGELVDCKTLLLVQTLRLRRPDLFLP